MKIYFSGAHASGKSTLARYVSDHYHFPMIFETARVILSEQELQIDELRSDLDAIDNYQREVFHRQLVAEKLHSYDNYVSDRSLIDILAYSAQHTRIFPELLNNCEFKDYLLAMKNSKIFFVRPTKATVKVDGIREHLNWDGIIAIDAMIKLLLEMYEIPYYQINSDSMQERIKFIDAIMKKW